jgi:hypothetical protein
VPIRHWLERFARVRSTQLVVRLFGGLSAKKAPEPKKAAKKAAEEEDEDDDEEGADCMCLVNRLRLEPFELTACVVACNGSVHVMVGWVHTRRM